MRFIVSLCISDMTSAAVSWLYLYRRTWGFDVWGIPFFLCEVSSLKCLTVIYNFFVFFSHMTTRKWNQIIILDISFVVFQFYWATDLLTSYVTALHILSFAILRYISIKWPFFYQKITIAHGNVRLLFLAYFVGKIQVRCPSHSFKKLTNSDNSSVLIV